MRPRWQVCENSWIIIRHQGCGCCVLLSPHSSSSSDTDATTWHRQVISQNINSVGTIPHIVGMSTTLDIAVYTMLSFLSFILYSVYPKYFSLHQFWYSPFPYSQRLDKVMYWKIHHGPKLVASVVNELHRHAHALHLVSIWPDWAFKHCIFCAFVTEIKEL